MPPVCEAKCERHNKHLNKEAYAASLGHFSKLAWEITLGLWHKNIFSSNKSISVQHGYNWHFWACFIQISPRKKFKKYKVRQRTHIFFSYRLQDTVFLFPIHLMIKNLSSWCNLKTIFITKMKFKIRKNILKQWISRLEENIKTVFNF